jgi:hypothetical protein
MATKKVKKKQIHFDHDMADASAHPPATTNKGKIVKTNITTGAWEYTDLPESDKTLIVSIDYKKEETINHGMDKRPAISVYSASGEIGLCTVTYIDSNSVKLEFNDWFTGYATLN